MRRLGLWVAVGLAMLLNACGGSSVPASVPARNFTAEELLLTQDLVPAEWKRSEVTPVSIARFGFGNEEVDRWVGFTTQMDPQERVFSNHFVLNFQSRDDAANWYEQKLPGEVNDNNLGLSEPWATHSELTYTSNAPDQYVLACAVNNVAGEVLVCRYFAQYEEFIVLFESVIEADTTTVSGFNDLVEEIDNIMATHMQEP